MSDTFSADNTHYTVSNLRFCNLLNWSISIAEKVENEKKSEYIEKMQKLTENQFIPCTDCNFHQEFSIRELEYWSRVFSQLGYAIYEGKIGNQEEKTWQPTAIADALYLSRMLK